MNNQNIPQIDMMPICSKLCKVHALLQVHSLFISEEAKCLFEKALLLDLKLTFKILSVDFLLQFISLSFDPQGKAILELFYIRNLLFVLMVRTTYALYIITYHSL